MAEEFIQPFNSEIEAYLKSIDAEKQNEIIRLYDVFREEPGIIDDYVKELRTKGDLKFSRYYGSLDRDNLNPVIKKRYGDYLGLGDSFYDLTLRQPDAVSKATKDKFLDSKLVQTFLVGPSTGAYNAIKGTAELVTSLVDLGFDTNTLKAVQEALPLMDLDELYGPDKGGLAKFSSLLTQYGLPIGFASSVAKKVIDAGIKKVVQTETGKAAAKVATTTKIGKVTSDVARYGGYYAVPVAISDAVVSASGQKTLADYLGDQEGFFGKIGDLFQFLGTETEGFEQLNGRDRAAAILRNKLRFGLEGTTLVGGITLGGKYVLKPTAQAAVTGTKLGIRGVDFGIVQPLVKVMASRYSGIPQIAGFLNATPSFIAKNLGIPKYEFYKFSEFNLGKSLPENIKRLTDILISNIVPGGRFDKQSQAVISELNNKLRAVKKDADILMTDLDREMYKLAKLGFTDIAFTTSTKAKALSYWDDIIKFMRGELDLKDLPKTLQLQAQALRNLIDDNTKKLIPFVDDVSVRKELTSNMGKYLHTSYEIFKRGEKYIAESADIEAAKKYFVNLITTTEKGISKPLAEKKAELAVNNILSIGRDEGTTPRQRLKAITKLNIERGIMMDTKNLPEEVSKLMGKVTDPKAIIFNTITEQAYTVNTIKAYNKLAESGLGKWLFRNDDEYAAFLTKNNLKGSRSLVDIQLKKPYAIDVGDAFTNKDGSAMKTLPEIAKALKDDSLASDALLKIPFFKSLLAAKAAVQANKTVYSLMTQARNISTASLFALSNGHVGSGASLVDSFGFMFRDILGTGSNKIKLDNLRKIISEAQELGVMDTSIVGRELEKMLGEVLGPSVFRGKEVRGQVLKTTDNILEYLQNSAVVKKPIEFYQLGDNVWKLYGFNYVKSQLKPAFKNLSEIAEYYEKVLGTKFNPTKLTGERKNLEYSIAEIAGKLIQDTYPNYSKIPTLVQNIRKFPFLGNFVAFQSEMIRNAYNIGTLGVKELAFDNPYVRQMGARRLLGFTTTMSIAGPVAYDVAKYAVGVPDKVLEAWRSNFSASYEKGSKPLVVSYDKEKKTFRYLNSSSYIPQESIVKPFGIFWDIVNKGPQTDESMFNMYKRAIFGTSEAEKLLTGTTEGEPGFATSMFGAFIEPSILAEGAYEILTNRKKGGGQIYDSRNDPDKFLKSMEHLWNKYGPTTLIGGAKTIDAAFGKIDKTNKEVAVEEELLKNITGVSILTADPRVSMKQKLAGYARLRGQAKDGYERAEVSADDLIKDKNFLNSSYTKWLANDYREWSLAYDDIKKLRDMEFSEKEIFEIFKGRRAFSEPEIQGLMAGVYMPPKPTIPKEDTRLFVTVKELERKGIINRETNQPYTVRDFFNVDKLANTYRSFINIPLELPTEERKQQQRKDLEQRREDIRPKIEEFRERIREQRDKRGDLITPITPTTASPVVSSDVVSLSQIQPTQGLTRTESALLSPFEQQIALRQRGVS